MKRKANAPADRSASSHDDDDHEAGGDSTLPEPEASKPCTNCGYQYQEGCLWCPQCSQSVPTTGVSKEQKDTVFQRQFELAHGPGFQWRTNDKHLVFHTKAANTRKDAWKHCKRARG